MLLNIPVVAGAVSHIVIISPYLQTRLTGLDGGNITSDTTTNDHNIVVTYSITIQQILAQA